MRISRISTSNSIKSSFYKKESKICRSLSLVKSFNVPKTRIGSDNFNILADNDEYSILTKMTSVPHFYLEGNGVEFYSKCLQHQQYHQVQPVHLC